MQEQIYIVTNEKGLNVRSKPDTNTGAVLRLMANGEAFQVLDVFTLGEKTWVRVSSGNSVQQAYACIQVGNRIFARLHDEGTTPTEDVSGWATGLDAWARSLGYRGPRP